jgi:hypothetical protein
MRCAASNETIIIDFRVAAGSRCSGASQCASVGDDQPLSPAETIRTADPA